MDISYSPYKESHYKESKFKFPKIKFPKKLRIWLAIILGIIFSIFFIFYLLLGELRFFANHFLGMTFFSKNYLVVLQNDYELRPGGGFITGYGNMDFVMGFPKNLTFKNSYDIDTDTYITPPYPHEDLLKNEWYEGYSFRDANWNPNTPTNAKELSDFYLTKYPKKNVDGIFFINFSLIEKLIDEVGSIELNGKEFTKDNLFSQLEFEVNNIDRHNVEALENRKNILGDLASILINKAKHHPFKFKNVIVKGLHNKNLYIWLANKRLQNKLINKGWANALELPERSDFLGVNLANLGSKKTDRYLQTEIHYYANITKEIPEITTEVTLRYPGFTNTYSDNYKGYLRLYIPKNVSVNNIPVDSIEEFDGEFKVIGTKIILPAGSKTSLSFTYTLPRTLFDINSYKLRLLKQSGSEAFYKLTIEAPKGKLIESNDFDSRENRASFTGQINNDKDFNLKIIPDNLPPYPIEQEFINLNQINVIWNEPVDETSATNINSYTISDLNKTISDITDVVKIKTLELIQPNIVKFELEGVTEQKLEFYRIDMKGLKDIDGNTIIPNPKPITVVQRIKPTSTIPEIKLGEIPIMPEELAEVPAQ